MHQHKRHFKGHIISLRLGVLRLIPSLLCLSLFLLFLPKFHVPELPSSFFRFCLYHTLNQSSFLEEKGFKMTPYDLVANSVLSIKASEVMSKKYAAKYGGIIKKDNTENIHNPEPAVEKDASAKGITFINTPNYPADASALLAAPLQFVSKNSEPRILIVHTHTSEGYADSPGARSDNPAENVVSVGRIIQKELEKSGIQTIHDTTQNDYPSYNQSYKKAMEVIQQNLKKNPTLEIVLDVHRDYITDQNGNQVKPTVTLKNGKKAAQIMFVMGTDAMGLSHPDWQHNLSFSVKIQDALNKLQPGLCRSINIRTERFNQHMTKGSMIIEVGSAANTLDEAKESAVLIAKGIAEVLKTGR